MHHPSKVRHPGPVILSLAALVLAACGNGQVPSPQAAMSQGVGFGDYQRHLRDRENARQGVPYSIPPETRGNAATTAPTPAPSSGGPLPLGPVPSQSQPLPPAPVAAAPAPVTPPAAAPQAPMAAAPLADPSSNPQIADAQAYTPIPFGSRPADAHIPPQGTTEIVHVAAVPQGTGSGPNVMAYALQTRHTIGTVQHRRMNPLRWARWEGACLQFPNQDAAQEAFLANGGPERDSGHLDPDGDGFACWWDPSTYRQAASLGQ